MMMMPDFSDAQRRQIVSIADSYQKLTGQPLVAGAGDPFGLMWSAPKVIVAHGVEDDPVFFFGNLAALELFEMTFEAFTQLPSRYSAEPEDRAERALIFERLTRDDIIFDYEGVRVSATGKRFRISNASVWNLRDENGTRIGQAAAFADWVTLN